MSQCDIAIVGCGPYGLSAAAYLGDAGMDVRIFGEPMEFWANGMPAGMLLRSPREASTISDPGSNLTLEAYEEASQTAPTRALPGIGWLRVITDVPTALTDLVCGRLSPRDYLRSLSATRVEAVFDWKDPQPTLAEIVLLPYLVCKKMLPTRPRNPFI
jgi:hypothetical protein